MKKYEAGKKRKLGFSPGAGGIDSEEDVAEKRDFVRAASEFYGRNGDQSAAVPKGATRGGNSSYDFDDEDLDNKGPMADSVRIGRRAGGLGSMRRAGTPTPATRVGPSAVDRLVAADRAPTKFTEFGRTERTGLERDKPTVKFDPKRLRRRGA